MPKTVIKTNDVDVLSQVCSVEDIKILGIDTVAGVKMCLVSYKKPEDLFKVGQLFERMKNVQVDIIDQLNNDKEIKKEPSKPKK